MLVDVDDVSWRSWNRYAVAFAEANQASVVNIDDGGITGSSLLRSRGSPAATSTRVAEAPRSDDAADIDPPAGPTAGPALGLGSASPLR